jgi:Flp pilus assembly protein TadG
MMHRDAHRKQQRGATLVETAFGLMLFLLVIFGIMEYGRVVWIYTTLAELSREGSRYAAVHGSSSKVPAGGTPFNQANAVAAIRTAILPHAIGLVPAALTVTATWSPNNDPGSMVTVTVTYSSASISGLIPVPSLSSRSTAPITF